MEKRKEIIRKLPGWIAKSLMIGLTALWGYWAGGELYHEGWWGVWYNPLVYLVAPAIFILLAFVAFKWPRVGAGLIVAFGVFFASFFSQLVMGVLIAGVGVLFWLEGTRLRKSPGETPSKWWMRLIWMPTVVILVGFSVYMLPIVLTRQDDGDRSARLIEGKGVSLVWAPDGPGWNWQQSWGGYPSWDAVALYGVEPVGIEWSDKPGYGKQDDGAWVHATAEEMAQTNLCLYLSEDGLMLMESPQNIWRMPTVDEYLRSMARHGENAGCAWHGEFSEQVDCAVRPDKETPLWAPDLAPIYYWAAEEYDADDGYFVSYNGFVNATRKSGGNPRHSYRCVRDSE